jgi:ABC-2 type transport system ATP-binding protein
VSNGQLSVAGVDLSKAAAKARARIGYMSQKFSLYEHLSVLQNLNFFSSAYGLRNAQRKNRIQWALQQFELEAEKNTNSGDLPLGYKQRLAMACALMHNKPQSIRKVVVLPAPFAPNKPNISPRLTEKFNFLTA